MSELREILGANEGESLVDAARRRREEWEKQRSEIARLKEDHATMGRSMNLLLDERNRIKANLDSWFDWADELEQPLPGVEGADAWRNPIRARLARQLELERLLDDAPKQLATARTQLAEEAAAHQAALGFFCGISERYAAAVSELSSVEQQRDFLVDALAAERARPKLTREDLARRLKAYDGLLTVPRINILGLPADMEAGLRKAMFDYFEGLLWASISETESEPNP